MKKVKKILAYVIVGLLFILKIKEKDGKIREWQKNAMRYLVEMNLYDQWIFVHQDNKLICEYFHNKAIRSIAIYGMGKIGERFYDELKNTDITIKYIIDQKGGRICSDVNVITLKDNFAEVDAIIVTPLFHFAEIKEKLSAKTDIPVISIEDVLYGI